MKNNAPGDEQMEVFNRLLLVFLGAVTLAFIAWEVQDFAASFAANEMTTHTTLRTLNEPDDSRILHAFEQARLSLHVKAVLATESNPRQQTRDARLTVTGDSKSETLANRAALVSAMQTAFKAENGDELHDLGNVPNAVPVRNRAYLLVKQCFRWGALGILLLGLTNLAHAWKPSGLPRAALFAILATAFILVLTGLGRKGTPTWFLLVLVGPPAGLITLIAIVTQRVRRARYWSEGRARILTSRVQVEHHRFSGDTTKVRNLPRVEYEFDVGTGPIRGDRISLGFGTADNVDQVLKHYPLGATVPVFYDPSNPQDCALERDAPVSARCLWGGTIFAALAYEAIVLSMSNAISISHLFDTAFPQIHHPLGVAITGLLGLLALTSGIWNMLHPRRTLPWTKTIGTIVSSNTESFRETNSSHGHVILYRPVIEFSYKVEAQEYHNIIGSTGVSMASSQRWADSEVARYPAGTEVDVFYNPNDPTQSSLKPGSEMMLSGRVSLVVAVVLIAVSIYLALH